MAQKPTIFNTEIIDNQTGKQMYTSALTTLRGAGWESFLDSRYTTATPLTLVEDVETRLLFDSSQISFVQNNSRPFVKGVKLPLWDFDNNTVKAYDRHVGGIYKARMQMTAKASIAGTGVGIEAILRIPSGIAIVRELQPLLKGTSAQRAKFETTFYITQDEVDNGLEIYLQAIGSNVDIYNLNLFIKAGD